MEEHQQLVLLVAAMLYYQSGCGSKQSHWRQWPQTNQLVRRHSEVEVETEEVGVGLDNKKQHAEEHCFEGQ